MTPEERRGAIIRETNGGVNVLLHSYSSPGVHCVTTTSSISTSTTSLDWLFPLR